MRLIDNYSPYDYRDTFSVEADLSNGLDVQTIFERIFCDFPKPVRWLMDLRNAIVKPLGISGGGSFRDLVVNRNDEEIILCKDDRHLCFWVGIYCAKPGGECQEVSVTTVVRTHNKLGKIYFIGIYVFHRLLVRSMLRRAVK